MDLNTILQTCFTKHQALRKIEEMREEWEKETYQLSVPGSQLSDKSLPVVSEPVDRKLIDQNLITENRKQITKMDSLIIFTAIPLPEEQIPILGNFVRKTFPQIKLIDLKVDPTLIGGACISWKGNLKDYSLRKAISRQSSDSLIADS
ncbi:MAG: F0F1 ATP synthase subunit delta [Candidatus Daviesbacteria bacterium]|nr:F0F1 ATP synthase subunit delta [Candidatus Daviesbacteria bacterium]